MGTNSALMRMEVENVFGIHPDLTVEILSPDQNATKVISNITALNMVLS